MKKIISFLLCLATVFTLASCSVKKTEEETTATSETTAAVNDSYNADLTQIAATTDKSQIKLAVVQYMFMNSYMTYSNYGYITSSTDIHTAYYDEESKQTWYDYLISDTKKQIEQYGSYYDKALEAGMTLSESSKAQIDEHLETLETSAASSNQTFDEYICQYFGDNMTKDLYREAIEFTQLGYEYYNYLYNLPKYTEEDIQKAYNDDTLSFNYVDYKKLTIKADFDQTNTDEEIAAAKKKAKDNATAILAEINAGSSFVDAYVKYYPDELNADETTAAGETTAAVDEATKKASLESSFTLSNQAYSAEDDESVWLFTKANVGETKLTSNDETGVYDIVKLTAAPTKNDYNTVNVAHILLSDDYSTEDEAKAKADEIVKQLNESDNKDELFAQLVKDYSSDTASVEKGGLYESIKQGAMVAEFNDWCFDPSRKEGDIGVVTTTYGIHIMYFKGTSKPAWQIEVEEALRQAAYTEADKAITEAYKITYIDDVLNQISNVVKVTETTAVETTTVPDDTTAATTSSETTNEQ